MQKVSIYRPENEEIENIRTNDISWNKFYEFAKSLPQGTDIPMVINGKKIFLNDKKPNFDPATGDIFCTYQSATKNHSEQAIDAALTAKATWAALSPATRIQKFRDLEVVITKWKYEICACAAVECGYTANEVAASWVELVDFLRFNNYFYTELLSEHLGDGPQETNQLILRPLKGFTCAVTPFNFPVAIGYHLPLVMALTGNTVVWKPSSDAVMTSYMLMLALEEANFPPGVINFITGSGKEILTPILKHPELAALNFTGSDNTARTLANTLYDKEIKRSHYVRLVAETGGKDFVVCDKDIDVIDTATLMLQGAFGRSGQKCSATSLILVDKQIWPALKIEMIKQLKNWNICNTIERLSDMGPVINESAYDGIIAYIDRAKKDTNCNIIAGGEYSKTNGYWIQPTIIETNCEKHELLVEEIFGPVLAIKPVENWQDAVKNLNNHHYRLTGSVISRNETWLEEVIPTLSQYAGNFYVNRKTTGAVVNQQPFGGDGASGTNCKAGGRWYLLSFLSQGTITRRHTRTTTPDGITKLKSDLIKY